jgi:hypothetical protein
MKKLTTGQDSTLGVYLDLCNLVFGSNSRPSQFVQNKIDESPNGVNEEVITDESQMIQLLVEMNK